jgi:hypothetical protein
LFNKKINETIAILFVGNKDINGFKNKNKTDKDSINNKRHNFYLNLFNIKMRTIKEFTYHAKLKRIKPKEK